MTNEEFTRKKESIAEKELDGFSGGGKVRNIGNTTEQVASKLNTLTVSPSALKCPLCGAVTLQQNPDGSRECPVCGAKF